MAKPKITLNVNSTEFSKTLNVMSTLTGEAGKKALMAAGYKILSDSIELSPVDTGTLVDSAKMAVDEVGPDTYLLTAGYGYSKAKNPKNNLRAYDYMVTVHEDVTRTYEKGGPKFLETAYTMYVRQHDLEVHKAIEKDLNAAWNNLGLSDWDGNASSLSSTQLGYLTMLEKRWQRDYKEQTRYASYAKVDDDVEDTFKRLFPGKKVDNKGNLVDADRPNTTTTRPRSTSSSYDHIGESEYGLGGSRKSGKGSYYD